VQGKVVAAECNKQAAREFAEQLFSCNDLARGYFRG